MSGFTHTPIIGRDPQRFARQGVGLVCEGGGTRGFYSSGVFEAFMDAGLMFPYIVGISAGAANALSYISGQKLRSRQIIENYVGRHEYVSKRNLVLHRSMFWFDYIFRTVPEKHIFYDWQVALRQPIAYNAGAFDCETGDTVWFTLDDLRGESNRVDAQGNALGDFTGVIASCSVPLMCPIVDYKGMRLLDGGILSSIPIEKSIADGNDFHVIVLTRNEGFVKPPMGHERLIRTVYRKYPRVAEALAQRHTVYNRQLALCEQLERDGKAIIIRPQESVGDSRTSADIPALLALHDEGTREAAALLPQILECI